MHSDSEYEEKDVHRRVPMTSYSMYPRQWVSRPSAVSSGGDIHSHFDDVISGKAQSSRDYDDYGEETQGQLDNFPSEMRTEGSNESSSCFRLVSFNILTDNCVREGQYLYCPSDIRYMNVRLGRILTELRTLDADVVCLQEVDCDNFRNGLKPEMERLGYAGINCTTSDNQGLATFWRVKKFQLVKERSRLLSEIISDGLRRTSNVDDCTRNALEDWTNRPEVTSLVHLRHLETGNDVAICNNHVGWMSLRHPILQALQIALAYRELVDFVDASVCALVFCGDFNTPPSFPGYQLLSRGILNRKTLEKFCEHHEDIDEVDRRNFPIITQAIPGIFQLPVRLRSAYFAVTRHEPSVTNCDGAHKDGVVRSFCLDYIWYRNLDPLQVLETPSLAVLTKEVALPNSRFPSDHVPIAADFRFR